MTDLFSRLLGRKPSHPAPLPPIRVLVVEGGGVRGIVTGQILGRLEERAGGLLRSYFDLLAGTSSGGISVMALASDSLSSAYELSDIFHYRAKDVFRRAPNPVRLPSLFRGSRYLAEGFDTVAHDVLGDGWLSGCKLPCVVASYLIEEGHLKLFGSAAGDDNDGAPEDFRLVDLARATTAAPSFFPPAHVVSTTGREYWCVDGGIYANAPVLQAVTEARRRFGFDRPIELVSVGPGGKPPHITVEKAQQWGGISWLKPVFDIQVQALNEQTHAFIDSQMPGIRLHRLAVDWDSLPEDERPTDELDDDRPENLDQLRAGSVAWLNNNDAQIKAVAAVLRQAAPVNLA